MVALDVVMVKFRILVRREGAASLPLWAGALSSAHPVNLSRSTADSIVFYILLPRLISSCCLLYFSFISTGYRDASRTGDVQRVKGTGIGTVTLGHYNSAFLALSPHLAVNIHFNTTFYHSKQLKTLYFARKRGKVRPGSSVDVV